VAAVATFGARDAHADGSLRIGTFNTWMLGKGFHVPLAPPAVIVPGWEAADCAILGCEWDGTPAECYCGGHPIFREQETRTAGAVAFADRIIKSGFDIIVLNEVWDPIIVDVLMEELQGTYPFLVKSIKANAFAIGTSSSGLMLFSKLPFQKINTKYLVTWPSISSDESGDYEVVMFNDTASKMPNPKEFISFGPYHGNEVGDDALAHKGVGYVRVLNNDRFVNVFFTHTQASYTDDFLSSSALQDLETFQARATDLEIIFERIQWGLSTVHPDTNAINETREDVLTLGDINVESDQSMNINDLTKRANHNLGEWTRYFNDTGALWHNGAFTSRLWDTWAFESAMRDTNPLDQTIKDDFGITNLINDNSYEELVGNPLPSSVPGARLDLILHNTPANIVKICNQHESLGYNLLSDAATAKQLSAMSRGGRGNLADGFAGVGAPSGSFQSDHTAVQVDYNILAPQCSMLRRSTGAAAAVYGNQDIGAIDIQHTHVGNLPSGEPDPDANNAGTLFGGNIANPGNVQWYYLPEYLKGTYLIGLTFASKFTGYDVQVFKPNQLSVAYRPSQGDTFTNDKMKVPGGGDKVTIIGNKWALDDPPYYLKVFNRDHDQVGSYTLGIHRCKCTDKHGEACIILPNSSVTGAETYTFPATTVSGGPTLDSYYFSFDVQHTTLAGQTQTFQTVVSNHTNNVLTTAIVGPESSIDVVDVVGGDTKVNDGITLRPVPDVPVGGAWNDTCSPGGMLSGEPAFTNCNSTITSTSTTGGSAGTTRKLLRVTRGTGLAQETFKVHWRTNLTVMQGIEDSDVRLKANELTDDVSPHDEIAMIFGVEGQDQVQFTVSEWISAGMKFPLAGMLSPLFPDGIRYLTSFHVQLVELDDDQNDYSQVYTKGANDFKDKGPNSAFSDNWSGHWEFDGGDYRFHYALSHRTPGLSPKFTDPVATLLSKGKPAIQSTTFSNWVAGLAVDGSSSTAGGVSVAATQFTANPWWYVDLGAVSTIESVRVYNCTSGCAGGTSSNLYIDHWDANLLAWVNDAFIGSLKTPYSVIPMGNIESRYVKVRKQNETNHLDLAEVQVWGTTP
jgi:hypothetical protein